MNDKLWEAKDEAKQYKQEVLSKEQEQKVLWDETFNYESRSNKIARLVKRVQEEGVADSSGITPQMIGALKLKVDDLQYAKSEIDIDAALSKKDEQIATMEGRLEGYTTIQTEVG